MKVLRCKDVGVDCGYVARGGSDCEVLDFAASHAKRAHGVEVSEDVCGSWRASIQDIPQSDLWTLG
jgi:predicted small metal-binding protein